MDYYGMLFDASNMVVRVCMEKHDNTVISQITKEKFDENSQNIFIIHGHDTELT